MWPPMPSSSLLARTTIAIAFQRTRLLMRRSISRSPGIRRLLVERDGVDVGRGRRRQRHRPPVRVIEQALEQEARPLLAARRDDVVERFDPLAGLGGVLIL